MPSDLCIQFYRVEVKVIPPDGKAQPRCRSVLRRFSHFTKLHNKVLFSPGRLCDPFAATHSAAEEATSLPASVMF